MQVPAFYCLGVDNRKINLRLCTTSQNCCNRGKPSNNTSGIKGVRENPRGRWTAEITKEWCTYFLGTFDTKEQAQEAHIKAALELHGDFARFDDDEGATHKQ